MTHSHASSHLRPHMPAWTAVVRRHGFVFLFGAMLVFFALLPVLDELREEGLPLMPHLTRISLFLLVLAGVVVSVSRTWSGRIAALAVSLTTIVLWALPAEWFDWRGQILRHLAAILFFGYAVVVFLTLIFLSQHVTLNLLCAALCVYLLLGIGWAVGYSLMSVLNPRSFFSTIPGPSPGEAMLIGSNQSMEAVYFSFATLTTLGYGDIVPISAAARLFTVFEAVIGQLFLTVLVAQLVAMHVVHLQSRRNTTGL